MRPRVSLDCTPDTDTAVNMEEPAVPDYELPPIDATTADAWPARRQKIIGEFEDHVYGRVPEFAATHRVIEIESGLALDGTAMRQQWLITVSNDGIDIRIEVIAYTPATASAPVPAFLVPNFDGNHTIADDPEILDSAGARRDRGDGTRPRGSKVRRYPLETIIERGYGLVTFYAADVDSDRDDGFEHGVQRMGYADGQTEPLPDEWGTIGAWAWACSEVLDSLSAPVSTIDPTRVIVGGHSRLGKTALWAAARDERFAAAFSNDSGCTGAALSRRAFGENVAVINALFPHWFCRNYRCYSNNEASLPVDQHQLIALIAPRPVHVASATEDAWADPLGEFLATQAASEAWEAHGIDGIGGDGFPPPGGASIGPVSYHLREGEHDLLAFDWDRYLEFADAQVRGQP